MSKITIGVDIKTPYQLLSFFSYIDYINSDVNKIFVKNLEAMNHLVKSFKDLFEIFNCEVIGYENDDDLLDFIKKTDSKDIKLVSVNFPKYKFSFKKINLVIISDGLSSYPSFLSMFYNFKRANRDISLLNLFVKFYTEKLLSKFIKFDEFFLFNKSNLKPNRDYINSFRRVISLSRGKYQPHLKNKSFIFIGQPLVKLGIMDKESYDGFIYRAQNIAKEKGLDFYYKPHPLECELNNRSFNVIDSGDLTIEEFCYIEKNVDSICSFYSTALITIPELLNINSYRFTPKIENLLFSNKQKILLSKVEILEK
ncbi:polysialyltransferase family glycosyltransferase [Photobacterium damselae]|uniref:polysialyltransferase family glycosyltransferase n=1 Tax=Photobacterium damselae TaxID=38293 RepID=UPI0030F3D3F8